MSKTNELIRKLRIENGLTVSELATILGVSKSLVSRWENDKEPSLDKLYQIGRYFRVSVDELLRGKLKEENNLDYLVSLYDLSKYDVPVLFQDGNIEKLVEYYKTCQRIRDKFLKLLPKAAIFGLKDVELEEFKYIRNYIHVNYRELPYETDFSSRLTGLDKNEMIAVKNFYDRIKNLSRKEREWKIEKIYFYSFKLYENEAIALNSIELFVEMFKLLPQYEKDSLLRNNIRRSLETIRNRHVLSMIENGANVVNFGYYAYSSLDERFLSDVRGDITEINNENTIDFQHSEYYLKQGNCSYDDYLKVVDSKTTSLLKEAISERIKCPSNYYKNLKSGKYDSLID